MSAESAEPLPDIALIVADDLDLTSLAVYSETNSARFDLTPNLDALARLPGAVAVQSAYSTSALCTPSRVSLLTGRYASRMWRQQSPGETVSLISFSGGPAAGAFRHMVTLPRLLARKNYYTGFFGKWHVGLPRALASFAAQSFSECHGAATNISSFLAAAEWQACLALLVKLQGGFHHASEVYPGNLEGSQPEGYHHPESMALAAAEFVRRARMARRPFFLWLALTLPHQPHEFKAAALEGDPAPLTAPPPGWDKDALIASRRKELARLAGMGLTGSAFELEQHASVAWLDMALQPVLHELLARRNTITVVTADHGAASTGKGSLYEGGVRVPLLMHWGARPGCAAWANSATMTHIDLWATLVAVAEAAEKPVADGRDWSAALWPAAGDCRPAVLEDTPPLFLEVGYARAIVQSAKWKLIRVMRPVHRAASLGEPACISWFGDPIPSGTMNNPRQGDNQVRLVYSSFALHRASYCNDTLLFDLIADPNESRNLASMLPARVKLLDAKLQEHNAKMSSPRLTEEWTTTHGQATNASSNRISTDTDGVSSGGGSGGEAKGDDNRGQGHRRQRPMAPPRAPPPPPPPFIFARSSAPASCSADGCWPSVYIIGAQKSATTSLAWSLSPMLCLAMWRSDGGEMHRPPAVTYGSHETALSTTVKAVPEIHAFDASSSVTEWVFAQPSRYTRLWRETGGRRGNDTKSCRSGLFQDASPSMHHWLVPRLMSSLIPAPQLPQLRLIAVLREPISRALSEYNHKNTFSTDRTYLSHFCSSGAGSGGFGLDTSCELRKWHACVEKAGVAERNGTFEQYAKCPGWDSVVMKSAHVTLLESLPGRRLLELPLRTPAQAALSQAARVNQERDMQREKRKNMKNETIDVDKGAHLLHLAKGMYFGQLERWKQSFARTQLLVLSFETIVADASYAQALPAILDFVGLGGSLTQLQLRMEGISPKAMQHRNSHDNSRKQHTIQCDTKMQLESFFAPWNSALYATLRRERAGGLAPRQEPEFLPFTESVPCEPTVSNALVPVSVIAASPLVT